MKDVRCLFIRVWAVVEEVMKIYNILLLYWIFIHCVPRSEINALNEFYVTNRVNYVKQFVAFKGGRFGVTHYYIFEMNITFLHTIESGWWIDAFFHCQVNIRRARRVPVSYCFTNITQLF